ncbi:MAG TPA: hypothetical protein VF530_23600 [Planctomycetota bacterium]
MSAQDDLLAAALAAQAGAGGAAALVLVAAARPWRGRLGVTPAWGAPLALGAGSALGFWLTRGAPAFPPAQATHWLFYALLAATLVGLLAAPAPRAARVGGAALALLQPWLLLAFQRERYWGRAEGLAWCALLALAALGSWGALARASRCHGAAAELGLALALALVAGAYGLGGGALLAQLAGAFALAAGLCALLGLWRRAPGLGTGGAGTLAFVHAGLAALAHWLYELSTVAFVLVAVVPFTPLVAGLAGRERPRTRATLALGAPLLVAGAALARELVGLDASAYG